MHALVCTQSFSAVVGPNGSGKSNVIDAMLFVFGRRAKQASQDASMHASATAQYAKVLCTSIRAAGYSPVPPML